MSATTLRPTRPGIALRFSLWAAQVLLFIAFSLIGLKKLFTPIAVLAVDIRWAGEYPEAFVRIIGAVDLAGGLGILLPALTRIKPSLSVAAALGCVLLQMSAIVFHLSRGEGSMTPLNLLLLALALFVLWGRARKASIQPRT